MPSISYCHKGDCRKEAVYRCNKLSVQYCDDHWSEFVQDNMMHFDCGITDHKVCKAEELKIADEINRLLKEEEQYALHALKKYIELYGNPELVSEADYKANGRTYFVKDTPEEKRIREYNLKAGGGAEM